MAAHRRFRAAKSLQEWRKKSQLSADDDRACLGASSRKRCLLRTHYRRRAFHHARVVRDVAIEGRLGGKERRYRQDQGVLPELDQPVRKLSRSEGGGPEAALSRLESCR